jgi:hypothetical protein
MLVALAFIGFVLAMIAAAFLPSPQPGRPLAPGTIADWPVGLGPTDEPTWDRV